MAELPSAADVRWTPEWFELQTWQRRGDWASLKKGSAQVLRTTSKQLRIALWWVEANTHVWGFQGLIQGMRLLKGLWAYFATQLESEDLVKAVASALKANLLQVSLAEGPLTFTTVVNAKRDPELKSEVDREVARGRGRWASLRSEVEEVEAALSELHATIGGWHGDELLDLKNTVADIRQTLSDWTRSGDQSEEKPLEPSVPEAPAQEPDYVIYLWIQDVLGESVTPHHIGWIEAISYTQSLSRRTHSEDLPKPNLSVEKLVDRSSPSLYHAVYSGRLFTTVRLDVCRSTAAAECFLRIEMSDAAISAVSQTAVSLSGRVRPTETVVFDYRRIRWTYRKLRPEDAAPVGNTSSVWTRIAAGPETRLKSKA